ncbi:hypothetical protein [Anoxybacter fermentans]|uniref:hypothetical protein n=1 Tax=Anoxybacter fermentans TaxID=1323375 RepID=UPI000F8F78CB|nr:hypothetical protein [Anoxybacter fermentans]
MKKFHSAKELAEIPIEELKNLLASSSKNYFRNIDQKSILVNQTAKYLFSIPNILAEQINFLIKEENFTDDVTPLTRTGNAYLRYYFIQDTQSMINYNSEYCEYYKHKFKETPRHSHKRALTLTARKLVRLVSTLLSKKQLYPSPEERKERKLKQKEMTDS